MLLAIDGAGEHATSKKARLHNTVPKPNRRKHKVKDEQQSALKTVKFATPVVQAVDSKAAKQKARAVADRKPPTAAKHEQHQRQLCCVTGLLAMVGNAVAIGTFCPTWPSTPSVACVKCVCKTCHWTCTRRHNRSTCKSNTALPSVQQFTVVPHRNEVVNATKTSNGSTMGSLSAVDLSTDGDSVVKHDCEEGGSVEKDQIAMMALRMSRYRHVTKEAWNGSRSCERHAYGQAGVVDVHVHGDNGCSQTE